MSEQPLRLVHGAAAIAKALSLKSERAAFHLLSHGLIPGSRKIGGKWVLDIDAFRASFTTLERAKAQAKAAE